MAACAGLIRRIDKLPRFGALLLGAMASVISANAKAQEGWVNLPNESVLVSEGQLPEPAVLPDQGSMPRGGNYVADEETSGSWQTVSGPQDDYGIVGTMIANPDVTWVGRVDALIAWRSAPPDRPLIETGLSGLPVLNANQMDSPVAAGPRFSIFRFNDANGTAIETTYFQLANWRSERTFEAQPDLYALAPPGIYGNDNTQNFDTGFASLGASLKSLEVNRHWWIGDHVRFLGGFRWMEWQENFFLADEFVDTVTIQDFYRTNCMNSLYGGQIGLDAVLFTLPWLRCDSVVKGGAYYNNAVQTSLYASDATGSFLSQSVTVNQSPVSCSFVGEVGVTGVIPVTNWLDVRVGYTGLWLTGLVQPTQQLSGQVLTQPAGGVEPTSGTITANGGTVVQAVTLGLEGRW